MISLLTMTQGNPVALERTLRCFHPYVTEIVLGDLTIFPEDQDQLQQLAKSYPIKIIRLPFNYIFHNGFAETLNLLASTAKNDHVLYMNVGEIIDPTFDLQQLIIHPAFNAYCFDHPTEKHWWYRLYNRQECEWLGLIHEEVHAKPGFERRLCPRPSFRMVDTEKDMLDPFKAKVYNDIKELVYFWQYLRLVEEPMMRGVTNAGWIQYATDAYISLKQRLLNKGNRYVAFQQGNLVDYMTDIFENPDFQLERFQSSQLINFQGQRKDVL